MFSQLKGYAVGGLYVAAGILSTAVALAALRAVKDKVSK
jgi:hypothetical protein